MITLFMRVRFSMREDSGPKLIKKKNMNNNKMMMKKKMRISQKTRKKMKRFKEM